MSIGSTNDAGMTDDGFGAGTVGEVATEHRRSGSASSARHRPDSNTASTALPLPAAMAYCGRRVLEAMNGAGDAGARAVWDALKPGTRELLCWWFGNDRVGQRSVQFHAGQREAILHTILASELFGSDDPQVLFRGACQAWPTADHAGATAATMTSGARYRLRMVAGSGQTWVLQALIVWRWWSAQDTPPAAGGIMRDCGTPQIGPHPPRHARPNNAADTYLQVIADRRDAAERFSVALFGGPAAADADVAQSSGLVRHADLFLPPRRRASFIRWLTACAAFAVDGATPRCDCAPVSRPSTDPVPQLRLWVGMAEDDLRMPTEVSLCLLAGSNHLKPHLSIEFDCGESAPPAHLATLCDLSLSRALEIGAVKSLALVGLRPSDATCAHRPRHRRGRRPVLPRRHRPCLEAGLALLERIERQTAALRLHAGVASPALLVLCEDATLRRAVAAYLRQRGHRAAATVCVAENISAQRQADIVIDTLPPRHAAKQSRFCAVVLLGATPGAGDTDAGAQRLVRTLSPALAPHWRAPAFAATKAEQRERIGSGRPPQHLIDVLPVIAETWPQPMPVCARMPSPWLHCPIDALPAAAGEMFFAERHPDAEALDIVLPDPSPAARRAPLRWWSQRPPPLLHASRSLPVGKCVHRHQGWSARDDGLTRGLIEMAEADPHIGAFCLFGPAQPCWPTPDDGATDDETARGGPPVCPHALVRTPGYLYVVRFAPYLPATGASVQTDADTRERGDHAHPGGDGLSAWCRRVNALPGDRRQFREWRPVQLQAPLFWSWKRRGGSLSSLLSALAETTPITARRPRLSSTPSD